MESISPWNRAGRTVTRRRLDVLFDRSAADAVYVASSARRSRWYCSRTARQRQTPCIAGYHSLHVPKLPLTSNRPRRRFLWAPLAATSIGVALVAGLAITGWRLWRRPTPSEPSRLTRVVTLAGEGPRVASSGLADPFGVAASPDGAIYVTDGDGGRVFRIASGESDFATVAEGLDMPSALVVLPGGDLAVANTGAHTIVRVNPETGAVTIAAGATGKRGFANGTASEARFDAPIGVAASSDGSIFVADTYNDRIRKIAPDGAVTTIAGGDGTLDTPCGVAVAPDGAIVVADTGHARLVRIDRDGTAIPVAGPDGLAEPTGLAIGSDGAILVADAGESTVWSFSADGPKRFAGDGYIGRADGELSNARFNRPTGVAVTPDGIVVVADSVNGAVRAIVPAEFEGGRRIDVTVARYDLDEMRAALPSRWPYSPPERTREIAATFGEARTENWADGVWMHNALDVPGPPGETVRAIVDERVRRPLAAAGAGDRSEYLRLSIFAYVHVRIGRDSADRVLPGSPFEILTGDDGSVRRIRLRRGERIAAGQAIGTLNRFGHVHLTLGSPGGEINPLLVLRLPGLVDTIAPAVESVSLETETGTPIAASSPFAVSGRVRVLVQAWDRTDGNAERRRLGVFRLGYEVLDASGNRVAGEGTDRASISFERLPMDARGGQLAFARGSRSWFSGPTVFIYPVTNIVRDGESREEFFDTSSLEAGAYTLRVFAEDAFGNRTARDVAIQVVRS